MQVESYCSESDQICWQQPWLEAGSLTGYTSKLIDVKVFMELALQRGWKQKQMLCAPAFTYGGKCH